MRRIGSWLKRENNGSTASFRHKIRRPSKLGFSIDHSASTSKSILSSLLTLYGLMLLMLGVVIPISDALAKPVRHAVYRQIFYIGILCTGIASILYISVLVWWLQRQQRHRRGARLILGYGDDFYDECGKGEGEGEGDDEGEYHIEWANGLPGPQVQFSIGETSPCLLDQADSTFVFDDTTGRRLRCGDPSATADAASGEGGDRVGELDVDSGDKRRRVRVVMGDGDGDGDADHDHDGDDGDNGGDGDEGDLEESEDNGENGNRKKEMMGEQGRAKQEAAAANVDYEDCGPQLAPEIKSAASSPSSSIKRRRKAKMRPTRSSPMARGGERAKAAVPRRRRLLDRWEKMKRRVQFIDSVGNRQPKMMWAQGGVNLYLRLGAVVFGFGVMIHDGFKIAEVLERPQACNGPLFMPKQVIHLLFIICQTYYVFKYHRVVINTQKSVIRFMMVHLIATNLCIWVKTVVYEIKVGLIHSTPSLQQHEKLAEMNDSRHHAVKGNGSEYCSQTILEGDPSHRLGPYLYPCAVEYGLICAAICFKFFRSIGDCAATPYGQKGHNSGPRFSTCHKSHKGLFIGLMIMMCVLVPIISLIFLQNSNSTHRGLYVLVVQCVECTVLLCTSAMAVGGTITMIRQLRFSRVRGNAAFEVNLLFVGLAGLICYNLFVTISVLTCLLDSDGVIHCHWKSSSRFYNTKLEGIKSLLEVVQSTVQTFFIMQAIQRKVSLQLLRDLKKPGRGVTIALLISNLAMWVASVFEAQRNISQDFLEVYFGQMPWSIIKYICLPLIIFFRFHSTICLSEIWIHSYKLTHKESVTQ